MQKRKLNLQLFLLLCVTLWAVGISMFVKLYRGNLVSSGLENFYVSRVINTHEHEYLFGLRDTLLGCHTLKARNPDIVFFGDSHTYAGWDFPMLQQAFKKYVIGACPVSGAYPDTFADLLLTIKQLQLHPKAIIIGLSPRMLWQDSDRARKIQQARDLLHEISKPQENLISLFTKQWHKIPRFIPDGKKIESQTSLLEKNIALVDPTNVNSMLKNHLDSIYSANFWLHHIIETHNVYIPAIEQIEKLQTLSKQLSIKLIFVHIPESRWLVTHYQQKQIDKFHTFLNKIEEMGFTVLNDHTLDAGYENINYVNRFLVDDYPYALWTNYKRIKSWIDDKPSQRKWQLFDPDHLSAIGAKKFTRHMMPILRNVLDEKENRTPAYL